ncbi:ferritin-like domain-containing protein [Sinorhizobium medicae]
MQLALELEWATLPPYLVALLSIKGPQNREAADLIRGVAMEEMLHFALVANVINAIGGRPVVAKENCPTYPMRMTFEGRPFADRTFPINLGCFSKEFDLNLHEDRTTAGARDQDCLARHGDRRAGADDRRIL